MQVRTVSLLLAPVFCGLSLLAQEQRGRPVFRSGVELVQIDVSVLDGKRHPVRGLTASDFTVLENGVPRPVRAFNAVDLPAASPPGRADWVSSVAPDVATNDVGAEDGRLVIILLDRTIPPGQPTITANRIATSTVNALGAHDLAAVVSTSGGVPQDFTADHARLLRAINQGDPSTDISQDAKELLAQLSAQSLGQSLAPDPLSDGRCLCGLCVLDTVTHLADALRGATARRKTLFFIGSNLIVQAGLRDPTLDVGCDRLLKDARQKMFASLALSSMTVHSLDPTGIVNVSPVTRASSPLRAGRVQPAQQDQINEFLGNQESLGILPERTGGRRVINTNLPEEKVPEIFRETESYYVLAFEPGMPAKSDATRSLEVRVARKDVRVYTQRRYIPPVSGSPVASRDPVARPALDAAIAGLLPVSGRALSLGVSSFAGPSATGPSVAVVLDASSFARAGSDVPVEIAVLALNRSGRPMASVRRVVTLSTGGAPADRVAEALIETRLELPPGDYEIRAAVRDPATDVAASVFAQVVVPAFSTAPLSLSDIALETASLPAAARPGGSPSQPVPIITTTRRSFSRTEQVRAYMQIYQALARTDAIVPVTVRVRIVDSSGRAVRDQSLTFAGSQFRDRRAECQMAIPVEHLAAGEYLLSLEAVGGKESVARAVRFSVR